MVRPEFKYHELNESGQARVDRVAEVFSRALDDLEATVPSCQDNARDMALVRTKLQEACFFAKRAVAIHPGFQAKIDGSK